MPPHPKKEMQLHIPPIPSFPLSSPISEEIASPVASSDEDWEMEMERTRPFDYLAKAERGPPRKAEFTGVGRGRLVEREGPVKKQSDGVGGGKPVGLNLVTDFAVGDAARPAFVNLNDLKVLSRVREKERSAQKIRGILKEGTAAQGFRQLEEAGETVGSGRRRMTWLGSKGIGSLRRKNKDELLSPSPSDRPVMAGYTVPPGESSRCPVDSQRTPLTPSIVVTPAKDGGFWKGLAPEIHHPRAASSVYSQRTSLIGAGTPEIPPPPVPTIPDFHAGSSSSAQRESIISTGRPRSYSTGTVLEEDAGLRPRSYSNEGSEQGLDRLSIDTYTNRRQSQGWWTYLLSPILGHSSTIAGTPTTERPPVPTLDTNPTVSSEEWWEKEVSYFSPDTPETGGDDDVTKWPDPGAVLASADSHENRSEGQQGGPAMFSGETIQGAAAEYYQACAHELFSGRPYFECTNHVCSITPKDEIPANATAESSGDERNLLIDVDDEPQAGSRRSVDEGVSLSASRVMSGSTAVDEAPHSLKAKQKKIGEITGEGPRSSPRPELDRRKTPPWITDRCPEKQDSYLFFQPTTTVAPAANNIHIHAPASVQAAPVAPQERIVPQYIVVPPSNHAHPQPLDPTSPGLQQATVRSGSIPLSDMVSTPAPAYLPNRRTSPELPPRIGPVPVTRAQMVHPWVERERIEGRRRRLEREDAVGRKAGGLWRGRGCVSNNGCFGRPGREGRLRRRWYMAITTFFILIVAVAVVLAIMLTRKGNRTPVQSRWLNLTGYPPMPTGIATITGPEPQVQNSGCITPPTLWSCALPPEQQEGNKPYAANQPSFRVDIRFRNGTATPSGLFDPSPSPPTLNDLTFLGNTTDGNAAPFAGEETPFFITFLPTIPIPPPQLSRRAPPSFPDIESLIPRPDVTTDGTAAAATLYPRPSSQPVRLYNRGLDTEHYGFHTYFDRSIFLETTAPLTGKPDTHPSSSGDGGASKPTARVRCTWAQTRFLVQIWTMNSHKSLLRPIPSADKSQPRPSSSAMDFVQPGSFPYPVTITLDRHGGLAADKMVYCYAVEGGRINATERKLQIEDRGFGGQLVNPAPGIFNLNEADAPAGQAGLDTVDGGTGGCSCRWANWVSIS